MEEQICAVPLMGAYRGPRGRTDVLRMPRIPDELTYGISFTYRTVADAEANARHGGTAFLIGKPIEDSHALFGENAYLLYAVTNYHVAWGGYPVLRLNRQDGVCHIIDLSQSDWTPHPDGDDLAITHISKKLIHPQRPRENPVERIKFIPTMRLITPDIIKQYNAGLGDEVFMIGRFLNHQGDKNNIAPAVRLGNISMMPQAIWNSFTNSDQTSFAVEMRSRTGFSGSPVVVYRDSQSVINPRHGIEEFWWWLLGVNWGYINEKDTGENTWLNGVVPAWKILQLLEEPALADEHKATTADLKRIVEKRATSTIAVAVPEESAPPASGANPKHREDFNLLVNAAARKREQED